MIKMRFFAFLCFLALAWTARLHAADIVINSGTAPKNEIGVVFQISNANATSTIRLRGLFLLGTNGGSSRQFDWYCANGNDGFEGGVFGGAVKGGPQWRRVASCTPAVVEDTDDPGNPLTVLNFNQALDVGPGQVVTIAILQKDPTFKSIKYTSNIAKYTPADGVVFIPYRGLGSQPKGVSTANTDLTDPNFNLQQFGTGAQSPPDFRGFIGSINYVVVPAAPGS